MKRTIIALSVFVGILCFGCQKAEQAWFQSNVGRYQVLHYTTTGIPHTEFYIRVDTVTGKTELFYRDGGLIRYLGSFFSAEVEGKKLGKE